MAMTGHARIGRLQELSEHQIGSVSCPLGHCDGEPGFLRAFIKREGQKRAALSFLPYHLANAFSRICGIAEP
jgi:hypothetical protein